MGFVSFVDIKIFCYEILFHLVSLYSPFLLNLLNQNLQNGKSQKGNSRVSFHDTLLNFGLWCLTLSTPSNVYRERNQNV